MDDIFIYKFNKHVDILGYFVMSWRNTCSKSINLLLYYIDRRDGKQFVSCRILIFSLIDAAALYRRHSLYPFKFSTNIEVCHINTLLKFNIYRDCIRMIVSWTLWNHYIRRKNCTLSKLEITQGYISPTISLYDYW